VSGDQGHFCPKNVADQGGRACGHLGRCNNTAMPPRAHTEVGLAYEPLPSTLTLTPSQPLRRFVAAFHTSLEPTLGAPGAAASAAAATLAKYASSSQRGASLRQSHERSWAEEWYGGIEIAGNLVRLSHDLLVAAGRALN
jgi:hypothetical protein